MKVATLEMDREVARDYWRKYQSHVHRQTPADAEIAAIYKRIAQGKTVIRALESIRLAGLNDRGLPKLAIARADEASIWLHGGQQQVTFDPMRGGHQRIQRSRRLTVDWPGMTWQSFNGQHEATVPLIPLHLRPKRGLANYHILWEAEWSKRYPVDPYLLRRFGGDAWLVVAAWDLTEVERAVMQSRVRLQ